MAMGILTTKDKDQWRCEYWRLKTRKYHIILQCVSRVIDKVQIVVYALVCMDASKFHDQCRHHFKLEQFEGDLKFSYQLVN